MATQAKKRKSVLPGFVPTISFTLFYLSLIVLLPLSLLFGKTASLSWVEIYQTLMSERVLTAFKLTFSVSLYAALANVAFGFLLAWVLVRYEFPGKRFVDMLIDLPFALPTAVAGIAITTAVSANGMLGSVFTAWGLNVAFTPLGIVVALIFISFPFVVRAVQPVLQDLDRDMEEAAECLGAKSWQTFIYIILPALLPALLSGFAMAFARALGEYGSVVFIAGNLPLKTEIVPLLIVTKLEQYDYAGATAIASVMLVISFVMLFLLNRLQWYLHRHDRV